MNNHQSVSNSAVLTELAGTAFDAIQDEDSLSVMVQRMVIQCSALLRMQLERKAAQDPKRYDYTRVDVIIREFEAVSSDVQDTITHRVRSKLAAHTQQEVFRVLEDALADCVESLERQPDDLFAPPPKPQEFAPFDLEPRSEESEPFDQPAPVPQPIREVAPEPVVSYEQPEEEPVLESPHEASLPVDSSEEPAAFALEETVVAPAPEVADPSPALDADSTEEMYNDTVKLRIEATESVRQVVQFVDTLRRRPDLRLLQLVGSHKDGVGIWVSLRAPMPLRQILARMDGVAEVSGSRRNETDGQEPSLKLRLANAVLVQPEEARSAGP